MSKAKAKSKGAKKHTGRTTKPVEVPQSLVTAASKAMKNDSISVCEAIRKVAGQFPKVRRAALEQVFNKGHKVNLFTVRRQIQLGRSE